VKVDLHDISRKLGYKACMVKRFPQASEGSATHRLVNGALKKWSFASDARDDVLAY